MPTIQINIYLIIVKCAFLISLPLVVYAEDTPRLFVVSDSKVEQVQAVDDGNLLLSNGEIFQALHPRRGDFHLELEYLPAEWLKYAYIPGRMQLDLGPQGRPGDSDRFHLMQRGPYQNEWLNKFREGVSDPNDYLVIHGWYVAGKPLRFDRLPFHSPFASRYTIDGDRFPMGAEHKEGIPVMFAYCPEKGLLDCSGQFGASQDLATALLLDQPQEIDRLLAAGMNPNLLGEGGWAPVHLAATLFNQAALTLLQHSRSNARLRDSEDWTPLHHATARGNKPAAEILFQRRTRPGAMNSTHETALAMAVFSADAEYVSMLIENRVPLKPRNAWAFADSVIDRQRDDLVGHMIRERVYPITSMERYERKLVNWVRKDRLELLRLFMGPLELPVEEKIMGHWPVVLAAQSASLEMLELLLEHGASWDVRTQLGMNPLHFAATGNVEVISRLIELGLNPDERAANGWLPAGIAVVGGNSDVLRALLAGGADPDAEGVSGQSLLELALRRGEVDCVRILIEAGATIDFDYLVSKGLMEQVLRYDLVKVIERLSTEVSNLDRKSADGFSICFIAQRYGAERSLAKLSCGDEFSSGDFSDHLIVKNDSEGWAIEQVYLPQYPLELLFKYGNQTVVAEVVVDSEGRARFPVLIENSIPELERDILALIPEWRFSVDELPIGKKGYLIRVPLDFYDLGEVLELGKLTTVPHPIDQESPTYPQGLMRLHLRGFVVVEFVVDQTGRVLRPSIFVTRSSHPEFSQAAIEAISRWRFKPGELDGEPANSLVRIPIPFRMSADDM